jgi:hypothetical protein
MDLNLWRHPENIVIKGDKYIQNWIPNFNKLDITIDMGTIILGNTLSQFPHWHQMYLRFL